MKQSSITSTLSFQLRLTRSERLRASLLASAWACALTGALVRRSLEGEEMAVDAVFYSVVVILSLGILLQGWAVAEAAWRLRSGRPIPPWRWLVGIASDLAIPIAALFVLQQFSPRGAFASLTAPPLLAFPLVTMLSILRLQPRVSLLTGVAGAAAHVMLVLNAIRLDMIDQEQWPLLFSYGVFLAIIGAAASVVASHARANAIEAVAEAVAAEQAERERSRFEHDLSVARDIQQSLLPTSAPSIAGFEVAGVARPAQETGGDYYDWQPLPDGRLVVVLADVTGHGIGPALVMAVCRAYARATMTGATDATSLLSRINALLFDDLSHTGRFITMVIAILSPDGTVELISAGHGPSLLCRAATGEIDTFSGDGLPLGVMADETYGPHRQLKLVRGDVLLLATDGYMEWPRAGDREQFGVERMKAALRGASSGSARGILDALASSVESFAAGAPQLDDTTAVAIRRIE